MDPQSGRQRNLSIGICKLREPRSNVVGIGRGRITWRYTPERLGMANVTEHPANQGIINGIAPNGDAQEEDLIARKLTEMQPLPIYKLKCNERAKSGTWFARDNVTNSRLVPSLWDD
ncbi:hypothetical protein C0Q70_11516 [Pomacea canaliculata]|uniref:Uncharacterized protein n=1 Tax=Pomacea canaliculata TaxID=400727 RepID=A0A2T7P686_POMCA|nr:hypothetical protein C0Q70_11516 [Pomacea canaliculata]